MKTKIHNLKHEIINFFIFKEINKDEISHRFPHFELLFRGIKNFRRSYKPLNCYERIYKITAERQNKKYIRFGSYRKIRSYGGNARKINNLIF